MAVTAVAGAVARHPDDRPFQSVIRHAAGDMGVVVLNPDEFHFAILRCQFLGVFCR